jgi:uncharacterized membrane protein
MEPFFTILSLWLHALATVLMIGFYLLLGLVFLPFLEKQTRGQGLPAALSDLSTRMLPWIGISFLIFIVTGVYLMLGDSHYPGFGQIFANPWTILMVVKHVLVIAMLGLGAWQNGTLRLAAAGRANGLGSFKIALAAMNACSIAVLLLTTLAQAQ